MSPRYTPQLIDLDHKLKPFIPDFIPAVGDIDAFLKVQLAHPKNDLLGVSSGLLLLTIQLIPLSSIGYLYICSSFHWSSQSGSPNSTHCYLGNT